jgi:Flp pilus assembly protein TadG
MIRKWQRIRNKGQRGQALVEFSLVMLVLFLLLFGVIDFARVFFAYATMSHGVREGARWAVVHSHDSTAIENRARQSMLVIGGTEEVQVIFPDTNIDGTPCRTNMCRVQLVATTDLAIWTPVVPSIHIVARATMHIE